MAFLDGQVSLESSNESMAPLRGFIYAMSLSFPVTHAKLHFGTLNMIVNAMSQSPTDVVASLQVLKDAKAGGDQGLLIGFRLIPQGKKIQTLAQEYVDSRQESMKAVNQIDEVKSKASTFRAAVKSMKMPDLVSHCLELMSSMRTLKQMKCFKDDEGSQAALQGAVHELTSLCNEVCDHHVVAESAPWIESQVETLKNSQIMCKPPGWEVMKLAGEYKSVFSTELQILVDLSRFYARAGDLSAEVEAILKIPPGDASKCRDAVLNLCKASNEFSGSKAAVFVTCPGLYIPCNSLTAILEKVVSQHCVRSWQEALATPRALLQEFIKKHWKKDEGAFKEKHDALEKASSSLTDASLLATGFGKETQENVKMATYFVEAALNFAKVVSNSDDDKPAGSKLQCLHGVFVAVGLAEKGSISVETSIRPDKIKQLSSTML